MPILTRRLLSAGIAWTAPFPNASNTGPPAGTVFYPVSVGTATTAAAANTYLTAHGMPAINANWSLSSSYIWSFPSASPAPVIDRVSGPGLDVPATHGAGAIVSNCLLQCPSANAAQGTWAATTAYSLNNLIQPTVNQGGHFKCTTAGTTGSTEPTWNYANIGSTTSDGSAVWTYESSPNIFGVTVHATGATIINCKVSGTDATVNRVGQAITQSVSDPTLLIQACDISWCRVGVSTLTCTVTGCYIHDFGFVPADHTDGILSLGTGGNPLVITGNTILVDKVETAALDAASTSDVFSNCTFSGNLVGGGDWTLYCGNAHSFASRTDTTSGGLNGTTTVTDSHAAAGDLNATVTNTTTPSSIPAGTTITAVNAGVSYTLSAATTGGTLSSQTLVIHFTNNIAITGNTFSTGFTSLAGPAGYPTSGHFGPVTIFDDTVTSNTWSGNAYDTGVAIGRP